VVRETKVMAFVHILSPHRVNTAITLESGRTGTPLWWAARGMLQEYDDVNPEDFSNSLSRTLWLQTQGYPMWHGNKQRSGRAAREGELVEGDEEEEMEMVQSRLALAKLLVEKGADVNAVGKDERGYPSTPLWWAAMAVDGGKEGGLALTQLLVEKGADVNAVGRDDDGDQITPLCWAAGAVYNCREGGLALAQLLVEKGAHVNAVGEAGDGNQSIPLWWAAQAVCGSREGGLALAQLLVEKGAHVNAAWKDGRGNPSTPLWWAARAVNDGEEGGLALAQLLVEKGAGVNTVGKHARGYQGTPLWLAAISVNGGREGGLALAQLLVEKGANVNAVREDRYGNQGTPLLGAAMAVYNGEEGGLALAQLLVEKGADVNAVGKYDGKRKDFLFKTYDGIPSTPLWWAARAVDDGTKGGLALAQILVEKGADVNTIGKDRGGSHGTPLWLAATSVRDGKEDGLALAQLLVEKGADVNAVGTYWGGEPSTPLWWAARAVNNGMEGGLALAQLLVEKGADVNAVGKDVLCSQSTPLWLAARAVRAGREGGEALVQLLVSAGATLVDTEKAAHQGTVDGVMRTPHQGTVDGVMGTRNKMRAAFFGCPGTTNRTSLRGVSVTARSNIHLTEVFKDMYELVRYWTKEAKVEVSAKIGLDPEPERDWVMKKLRGFFNTDAKAHADTDTMLVYYSGHGEGTAGDWCLHNNDRISLDDVLTLWNGSFAKSRAKVLVLVLDSCHSGWWVERARDLKLLDVIIQAACSKTQTTLDGSFNAVFIDYQKLAPAGISHATAMSRMVLTRGDTIVHESRPCVYISRGGAKEIMCSATGKTFKLMGDVHSASGMTRSRIKDRADDCTSIPCAKRPLRHWLPHSLA
jgi:ankyrin repeat protein